MSRRNLDLKSLKALKKCRHNFVSLNQDWLVAIHIDLYNKQYTLQLQDGVDIDDIEQVMDCVEDYAETTSYLKQSNIQKWV